MTLTIHSAWDIPAHLAFAPSHLGVLPVHTWRKLAISREDVVAHLADLRIRIDTL